MPSQKLNKNGLNLGILLSMTLLTIMVSFWLKETYEATERNLLNQLQSVSSDVVVRAQDSLMLRLIAGIDEKNLLDLSIEDDIIMAGMSDTSKQGFNFSGTIVKELRVYDDSAFRLNNDSFSRIIAMKTRLGEPSTYHDSDFYKGIFDQLELELTRKGLPNRFKVITDDSVLEEGLSTLLMKDLKSRKQYSAIFQPSFTSLLKKMIPQIAFSILLLSLTLGMFLLLKARLAEKNRLLKLKDSFVSNITHELKTPIATIGVALDTTLEKGLNDPASKEYIDISRHELDRLNLLVERVLKIAQFENDQVELNEERIDLLGLVKEVSRLMRPLMDQKKMNLVISPENGAFEILGDRIHFTNVIFNLMDNGIKYGYQQGTIIWELSVETDHVVLSYSDDGPGIPDEYRERVFDRFFRVPQGNDHQVKGHGLGLSYVRQVVSQHRGNIVVGEREKQGVRFTIKIPRFGT